MAELDPVVDQLRAASAELLRLRPRVEAGEPWPLAERFGTEPEAAWGPRELLAHVAEMLPYWLGELERILAGPPPAPFGRVADDTVRIGIIGRDRSLPLRELYDRIEADVSRYAARLPQLDASEAARVGTHPTRGATTVQAMLERSVTGHLEEHVRQLRAILEAV